MTAAGNPKRGAEIKRSKVKEEEKNIDADDETKKKPHKQNLKSKIRLLTGKQSDKTARLSLF